MNTARSNSFRNSNKCNTNLVNQGSRKPWSGVFCVLAVLAGLQMPLAGAQNPADAEATMAYYLPEGVQYDPAIPTPEQVLGTVPGEWHVRHDQLVNYMYAVAEASDRVSIERFGSSYENRPLVVLTITSPQNHGRIEEIRQQHLALSDPSRADELMTADMPVVLYQGYSVHGNEPSGANAALLYAYHLAAAQGPDIENALANAVVLLDPSFNPDGLDRFAQWANSRRAMTLSTDPNNMEHNEPWPGGRTNHYWFDLNRDWLPLRHPESRARLSNFHRWRPNVLTDHHEMGSDNTFFFQPGIPSRTHPMTPQRNQDLTEAIAQFHAQALDADQRLYYARESFDDFYYGKGSTYPDINGAVGILFEQASSRGHARDTAHGVLRFPFTIQNQFLSSLSTLEGALALRTELLDYQREFYQEALDMADAADTKAYVFGDADDSGSAFRMAEILRQHQIAVHVLDEDLQVGEQAFQRGQAYVVPTNQGQHRLIESIFERRTTFPDTLFYDVSTWTFPYAFNTPFAELGSRQFGSGLLGERVEVGQFPAGEYVGGNNAYAYLFEWDEFYASRAMYRLLDAGIRAKVATEPFTAVTADGPREFDYGTILVPVGPQEVSADDIRALMRQASEEDGMTVYAMETGLSSAGIDLGSPSFSNLRRPSIALIAGEGTRSSEVGEAWHTFDQKFRIPVTLLTQSRMRQADLNQYNVLIMASGSYSQVQTDRVKQWVEAGGTLIVYKTALNWAAENELANITLIDNAAQESETTRAYAEMSRDRGEQLIGGSIFNTTLDLSHPLGYGYNSPLLRVFRDSTLFMELAENPYATPLQYTNAPLASGYVSQENIDRMAGTAAIVVSAHGSGRVIAMTDNPNFRAFWFGTTRLFMNAVFFGHTISGGASN
ncbi:M14 metallopeptidase family protein [Pseudohongiella sp.]|uniref:Peptidase M14 domain-containing protein n=1 Tax=marine sediment metagenome TaxID=412755 RepID=A0A0F9V547_9ZZZZ|nr:M14 metallopeptidase family protein [Pseudohongiella sp.]